MASATATARCCLRTSISSRVRKREVGDHVEAEVKTIRETTEGLEGRNDRHLALEGKISYREGQDYEGSQNDPAGHWAAHKDDGKK